MGSAALEPKDPRRHVPGTAFILWGEEAQAVKAKGGEADMAAPQVPPLVLVRAAFVVEPVLVVMSNKLRRGPH